MNTNRTSASNVLRAAAIASVMLTGSAHATNGLLAYGNGMVAHGVGGAGIANAAETMSAMDNPALAASVTGWGIGASGFNPNRSADVGRGYVESDSEWFLIPQGSWITSVSDSVNAGVAVNALGGMNTDYPPELFGSRVGVDLAGIIIAPTVAMSVSDSVSIGASLLYGYQQLETTGPGQGGLPRNDDDSASGTGFRIGLSADVAPGTTLGLVAQTEISMDEMDNHCQYLFAPASDCALNLPPIYGVGLTQQAGNWKILADVKQVNWSEVPVIHELFGWEDQTVYMLGAEMALSDSMTVRFGYNYGSTPIPDDRVQQNILAPAVTERHFTVGFTRKMGGGELSGYYARVANNEQTQTGTGLPRIKMDQNAFGFSYAISTR